MGIETILSICLGLGLSAATGFRIFVPLLVVNVAARAGLLSLAPSFEWIGGTEALVTFGIATVLEVGAYYVPWLDNFLDTVATPASVVAGMVVAASVITGLDPYLKWTLAVIAGGGVAGAVQAVTVGTRQASALTTAGFGNPVVSTVEMVGSLGLSVLSVLLPLLAVILVALFLIWAGRKVFRLRKAI
jgi:hypothetical protein